MTKHQNPIWDMASTSLGPIKNGQNTEQQQLEPMLIVETTPNPTDICHHTLSKPSILWVHANENQAITRTEYHLDDTNWTVWRHRLTLMLQICGVQGNVTATVQWPDTNQDPEGASNWDFNDTYVLIANNVTTTKMVS